MSDQKNHILTASQGEVKMYLRKNNDLLSYNERLFSKGIRKHLHLARFQWVSSILLDLKVTQSDYSILELGCYDGKLIDFLPVQPYRYVGFDANWEGGLDLAKKKYHNCHQFSFFECKSPEQMSLSSEDRFNMAVAMEIFEHIPESMVDAYLQKIKLHLNGFFFITVPNEKGIVFLAKFLTKKFLLNSKDCEDYSFSDVINSTLGRLNFVERNQHKGFDYRLLINQIEKYFDVIGVFGLPFTFLPASFSFTIAIIAKSRGS
ncbi:MULTISPECIES: bifunctional 2-polyprenyl-6-hydroxyphenol methylase/3-demethylubiquinol 3-O-methyltransferase UbiG [unclassified Thermosynechococcus]|uniref:class I SAM-dependent methyltransferase n=1 Tax=unclassified Thermosynechococcus TaxID=2622553 RepID=UPI00197E3457|nr:MULTISPECIES: methyltransferase domain-containing protein [unclassified Thermosynechococcus]MDR5638510.1 methyltransferase domain-containing protein [Thermosynechococcus sp. PP42]QSF49907.1 methyltransferase domain-containing protein [Thermosynechococcus sp. TA-1]